MARVQQRPLQTVSKIGIETNCLVIIPRRAIVFILFQVGTGTVGEGSAVVGIEPDRLVESFDREVVFALPQVSHTAVVEGLGVSRIELDRLIEILDGAVVVPLFGIGVATIVIGDSRGSRGVSPRIDERRATFDPGIRATCDPSRCTTRYSSDSWCSASGSAPPPVSASNSKMSANATPPVMPPLSKFHVRLPDSGN